MGVKTKTSFKKGHVVPKKWRDALREKYTGSKLSEARRKKMSEAHKERYAAGAVRGMLGKHHTSETRAQMSRVRRKLAENPEFIKRSLRRNPMSSLEKKMLGILQQHALPYAFVGDGQFTIGRKCPDFINTNGEKIAIEVFYREHKQLFRGGLESWKKERSSIFAQYGWRIMFFDETEVNHDEVRRRLQLGI